MKDKVKKVFDKVAEILLLVAGLQLGLLGALNFNLINTILGFANASIYANIVYIAVGIAAVWKGLRLFKVVK